MKLNVKGMVVYCVTEGVGWYADGPAPYVGLQKLTLERVTSGGCYVTVHGNRVWPEQCSPCLDAVQELAQERYRQLITRLEQELAEEIAERQRVLERVRRDALAEIEIDDAESVQAGSIIGSRLAIRSRQGRRSGA